MNALKQTCIKCGLEFEWGVVDERCASCWRDIALYFKRRDEMAQEADEAYGQGYMFDAVYNGSHFDSVVLPGLNDVCPYDIRSENHKFNAWARGFHHRCCEITAKAGSKP